MLERCALVHRHETPHTVYATTFSPTGDALAYAGGFFYGNGFLHVVGDS